jgi:uncharacterized membrane-anchored protein
MKVLRYILIAFGALGIAGLFLSQIKALENIRRDGEEILLNLRPADPRALMMGDYMALRYVEENSNSFPKDLPPSGQITLTLDENNVGTFNGLADNKSLAENEIRINYVRRSRGITFGAPRYYFQNGTAETYERAEYGVFKVSPSGRAILVGLADAAFDEILAPEN